MNPFGGFAHASRENDIELGRQAIKSMRFRPKSSNKFDFWGTISEATPSWQVALARTIMSTTPREKQIPASGKSVDSFDVDVSTDMDDVAKRFDPT
jgi:hypothetical protein